MRASPGRSTAPARRTHPQWSAGSLCGRGAPAGRPCRGRAPECGWWRWWRQVGVGAGNDRAGGVPAGSWRHLFLPLPALNAGQRLRLALAHLHQHHRRPILPAQYLAQQALVGGRRVAVAQAAAGAIIQRVLHKDLHRQWQQADDHRPRLHTLPRAAPSAGAPAGRPQGRARGGAGCLHAGVCARRRSKACTGRAAHQVHVLVQRQVQAHVHVGGGRAGDAAVAARHVCVGHLRACARVWVGAWVWGWIGAGGVVGAEMGRGGGGRRARQPALPVQPWAPTLPRRAAPPRAARSGPPGPPGRAPSWPSPSAAPPA
jgi:hypothetical protein